MSIEGIPFIIRFKTEVEEFVRKANAGIEGIPFIIRFKTIIENIVKYGAYSKY